MGAQGGEGALCSQGSGMQAGQGTGEVEDGGGVRKEKAQHPCCERKQSAWPRTQRKGVSGLWGAAVLVCVRGCRFSGQINTLGTGTRWWLGPGTPRAAAESEVREQARILGGRVRLEPRCQSKEVTPEGREGPGHMMGDRGEQGGERCSGPWQFPSPSRAH